MNTTALGLILVSLIPQGHRVKASPFDAIRWSEEQPQVQIGTDWHQPVAIDGIAVEKILAFIDRRWPGKREKRFAEDLVEVMVALSWKGDLKVDIDLRSLTDASTMRLKDVLMTGAKRRALLTANNKKARSGSRNSPSGSNRSRGSPPARIPVALAHADIDAFAAGLKDQFAYLDLGEVDLERELEQIRKGLTGDQVSVLDLHHTLHRLLMRFGDGHARISPDLPFVLIDDKYLPFLLVESSVGIVAVLPDRSALVNPKAPIIRSMDGRPMDAWIAAVSPYIARGSPQLIRRRALGGLRKIDAVRRMLGLKTGRPLELEFAQPDRSGVVKRKLNTSSRRPTYGDWPRSKSKHIEDDIGYLRIASMDGKVDALRDAMKNFIDTKGLIVDVRGNGGGTRELLLALGGYLIGPKEPAVVGNIAQYRRARRFGSDHLEARYMHRADWTGWNKRQRSAIAIAKDAFKPEWQPTGEFSAWHYLVLDQTGHPDEYFYDQPVTVLSDSGCFSATDIFLGALELLPRVTLLGTASSGGSARSQSFLLPKTGMEVRCASMASFRPDGRLYDGRGIEVDVEVLPDPGDFLMGGGDAQLKAALKRL